MPVMNMKSHISLATIFRRIVIPIALISVLAGCAIRTGDSELAFLQNGQLWTIRSDGTGAAQIAQGPVAGFAWAPKHNQMVFRTTSGGSPNGAPAPDAPGDLFIISVNGGSALQITPRESGILRSDAWWNPEGNRLLYRQTLLASGSAPEYYVSQADQPVGIARKLVWYASGIPVLSADGSRVAAIDPAGNVRVGTPGKAGSIVAQHALAAEPGTNRPARLLWQPQHDALLFMRSSQAGIDLVLQPLGATGHVILTLPQVVDVAFSPDGSSILVETPGHLALYALANTGTPQVQWPEPPGQVLPWWSPDGTLLLVQDGEGLMLINPRTKQVQRVLRLHAPSAPAASTEYWTPATGNPWNPTGEEIVFTAESGATWNGASLPAPAKDVEGLYVTTVTSASIGPAHLIHSGSHLIPAWSSANPSTVFLAA